MSSVKGIFTEAMLEEAAIEILESLGYDYAFSPDRLRKNFIAGIIFTQEQIKTKDSIVVSTL